MGLKLQFLFYLVFYTSVFYSQTYEEITTIAGFSNIGDNNGVAVADIDNDNDLDIFIVAKAKENGEENTKSTLFINNNDGSFTNITQQSGLIDLFPESEEGLPYVGLAGYKFGASWGDYDNDGFPDLFLTNTNRVQLFKNNGNQTFTNVTNDAGITKENFCRNTSSTWFDYNNDGFLDLFINDWEICDNNTFYENNGDGTFTDISYKTALPINLASYTTLPFDFDGNGFLDIYTTNDFNEPNSLFLNDGVNFTENVAAYNLGSFIDDMGIAVSDFDLNGSFDFFITGRSENNFFSNINGSYTNIIDQLNIQETGWGWDTRFFDYDLDGDEDLFIVNGFDFQNAGAENNVFFENLISQGTLDFNPVSEASGLDDNTIGVTIAAFDFDNDGDIDVFATNNQGNSHFYENNTLSFDTPSTKTWVKINLEGTVSNKDGIGSIITLETASGIQKRYYSGVGFLSQSLQAVHFGLEEETVIESITIQWPSGLVDTYEDIVANNIFLATEGVGLENLNIQPSQKIFGCTDPLSCTYNPDATVSDNSCIYLEVSTIEGANQSSFYKTETYTYALTDNEFAHWEVENGNILSGQNTDTVTIQWEFEEEGIITVTKSDDICSSAPVSLSVNLTIEDIPEDISIARLWNEMTLSAIRGDFARPTVHARNLFHTSVAMYDAWAIYDDLAVPYFTGNTVHGFSSDLEDFTPQEGIEASQNKAISYAMYRLLSYRFQDSPGYERLIAKMNFLMEELDYNILTTAVTYQNGSAATMGNYIAQILIAYGNIDNSNELGGFENLFYEPVNLPLAPKLPGNPDITDPNRWQPLSLDTFIDQSGNVIEGTTPDFLSPEWGAVHPFALRPEDAQELERDGHFYTIYEDPGLPPQINEVATSPEENELYTWNFALVSHWGSHHDPSDGVIWDISPRSIGNIPLEALPTDFEDHPSFYNIEGGDIGTGRTINPITNEPYQPQLVPRGDYSRVLAEFWADGPESETPPGHWFTILNTVNEHPLLERKMEGQGEELEALEWDVKCYFILGGAMHDAAISAWGLKGWYDYIRPVSSIRHMAALGQSSNPFAPNYHVGGIPLQSGLVEIVTEEDPLSGFNNEHIGKIKVYTWRGPDYIDNEDTDEAGVGWILAENWWPYQRPTFVTPPFAGFVSGHSTYSRAAAEVLTRVTGSEYFPGGIGEFKAPKDEFLVFEDGPSVDVTLQWATYRDASDQCSLSRIWGGIHPPADDIPGRLIGYEIGNNTVDFALPYFTNFLSTEDFDIHKSPLFYPNPTVSKELFISNIQADATIEAYDITGKKVAIQIVGYDATSQTTHIVFPSNTQAGVYVVKVDASAKMIIVGD